MIYDIYKYIYTYSLAWSGHLISTPARFTQKDLEKSDRTAVGSCFWGTPNGAAGGDIGS